jgi:nucleotide-binding universal stress UspA family protein
MSTRRILVAASLTDGRDVAFERGLALARASGAEMYLLHAVPANQPFSVGAKHRLERTAELRSRAEQAGVAVRTVEQHGDPATIIGLHANARAVDLIVMGAARTLGSRWLRRATIAERVLRRTTKPTLIVSNDDNPESRFGHLLVAVDLSPASIELVDFAMELAGDDSPRLTLVHAVKGIDSAAAVERARRELGTLLADVPSAIDTRVQIATGSHAKAIVHEAESVNADLVVVGHSARLRPFESTAHRLLRESRRSLLVVPVMEALRTSEMAGPYRPAA